MWFFPTHESLISHDFPPTWFFFLFMRLLIYIIEHYKCSTIHLLLRISSPHNLLSCGIFLKAIYLHVFSYLCDLWFTYFIPHMIIIHDLIHQTSRVQFQLLEIVSVSHSIAYYYMLTSDRMCHFLPWKQALPYQTIHQQNIVPRSWRSFLLLSFYTSRLLSAYMLWSYRATGLKQSGRRICFARNISYFL